MQQGTEEARECSVDGGVHGVWAEGGNRRAAKWVEGVEGVVTGGVDTTDCVGYA